MESLEDKLSSVLNNPQLMQQIMAMASSMGQSSPPPQKQEPPPVSLPDIDPALISQLANFSSGIAVDNDQRALLNALCPYISRERVSRLERAMRAAKLAGMATAFLGGGGHV